MQIIDVRDLAQAHVGLLEGGKSGRYLVAGHFRSWDELGPMLDRVTGRTLRKVTVPAWILQGVGAGIDLVNRFYPLDTPATGEGVTYATQWVYADDSKLRGELGIEYRPLEHTLADTVRWLAEVGEIDDWWAAKISAADQLG